MKNARRLVCILLWLGFLPGLLLFAAPPPDTPVSQQATKTTTDALQAADVALDGRLDTVEGTVSGHTASIALKAPLISPTFTGTPAAPTAAAGTNTTQLANTAFVTANFLGKPKGPFANDLAATSGGVALNEVYLKTGGTLAWRVPPTVTTIAFFGDSITERGFSGLTQLVSIGYAPWAQVLGGSKWDFKQNGSTLEFASGGQRSDQLIAEHLANLLASGASAVVEQSGVNDVDQGIPTATIVANRLSVWMQCRAAGIYPIATEITPVTLLFNGNSGGAKSASILAANAACKAAALANNVPWVEWNSAVETTPGNGILNPIYTDDVNDHIHPNRLGAYKLGRVLAVALAANFGFSYDPYANTAWETPNVILAGSSGSPTGWNFSSTGLTLNSKSTIEAGTYDWWRFDVSQGASSSNFSIDNFNSPLGGSPVGKSIESICEVQVISGVFEVSLQQAVIGGSGQAYELQAGASTGWGELNASDGPVVLRTPAATIGSGATLVWPQIIFRAAPNTSGVIQFRRMASRVH